MRLDKYIEITDLGIPPHKKTRILQVNLKQEQKTIGIIRWDGGWRRYVFLIYEGYSYYDSDLLRLIADRCDHETKLQLEGARLNKQYPHHSE